MGSDFDDRMQENCDKFYDVIDVLVTDDIDALDALKTKVDNFPNGQTRSLKGIGSRMR